MWDCVLGAAVLLGAYLFKIRREEKLLSGEFGAEYAQFKRETPMLVPRVFKTRSEPSPKGHSPDRDRG
jgi:protein-S-isoprenylcysteine O-methyltransferase Ste14